MQEDYIGGDGKSYADRLMIVDWTSGGSKILFIYSPQSCSHCSVTNNLYGQIF